MGNFEAAMMALAIPGVFACALAVDTNPFTGRRIHTLGRRVFEWYCDLKIWSALDNMTPGQLAMSCFLIAMAMPVTSGIGMIVGAW